MKKIKFVQAKTGNMQYTDIKKNIPSFLTSLNLFAGSAALFLAGEGKGLLIYASYLIFIAALFDWVEDVVIRRSKTNTDIGKELASLADLVSFGVAPAAILYKLFKVALKVEGFSIDLPFTDILLLLSPTLVVIFSALRLAKFNVERKKNNNYIGLPTPAYAILVAALPLILDFTGKQMFFPELNYETWFLLFGIGFTLAIGSSYFLVPIVLVSILLIFRFPMFAFRFKKECLRENIIRVLFLTVSFGLFLVFQPVALPLMVVLFIVLSLVNILISKLTGDPILD